MRAMLSEAELHSHQATHALVWLQAMTPLLKVRHYLSSAHRQHRPVATALPCMIGTTRGIDSDCAYEFLSRPDNRLAKATTNVLHSAHDDFSTRVCAGLAMRVGAVFRTADAAAVGLAGGRGARAEQQSRDSSDCNHTRLLASHGGTRRLPRVPPPGKDTPRFDLHRVIQQKAIDAVPSMRSILL